MTQGNTALPLSPERLYRPADLAALRFETTQELAPLRELVDQPRAHEALRFGTETNYDKLEVWTWKSGAWVKVKSYTGTTGPALTDEFAGQYHYLKFVSDSSVTGVGVSVDVQYR